MYNKIRIDDNTWPLMFVLILFLSTVSSGKTWATVIEVSAFVEANNFESVFGSDVPPQDNVTGNFSAVYDDSALTGNGFEQLREIVPTEAFMTIAGTIYNEQNTLLDLTFDNGRVITVIWYGSLNGSVAGAGTNDFNFLSNRLAFTNFTYTVDTNSTGLFRSKSGIFDIEFSSQDPELVSFDFPVGPPDGEGYEIQDPNGTAFLEILHYDNCGDVPHPGEDWNAIDRQDEFGDPVFAVSKGTIEFSGFPYDGWGFAVLIRHDGMFITPVDGSVSTVWSWYGHLGSISSNPADGEMWKADDNIEKGQQLGTVGYSPFNSGSAPHLHFEIRSKKFPHPWFFPCSKAHRDKEWIRSHYLPPSEFIDLNR